MFGSMNRQDGRWPSVEFNVLGVTPPTNNVNISEMILVLPKFSDISSIFYAIFFGISTFTWLLDDLAGKLARPSDCNHGG